MAHPATRGALAGLVTAGAITQADMDALTGLSDKLVSPFENSGVNQVKLGDVIEARSGRY